jgi:CBS domain-containing protein
VVPARYLAPFAGTEFNDKGATMRVSNVMSRDVRVVAPDQTLRDVAATMKEVDIGILPVAEKTN